MEISYINEIMEKGRLIHRGAEAILYLVDFLGTKAILKLRTSKKYRNKELDNLLRRRRTAREANILYHLYKNNFPAPKLYYVNLERNAIIMEYLEGLVLKEYISKLENSDELYKIGYDIGKLVAHLHNLNVIHNDLATRNFIVTKEKRIYLIDFGLSMFSHEYKEKALDIDVFKRVLDVTHPDECDMIFDTFIQVYTKNALDSKETINFYYKLSKMGRYHIRGG
ncbi:Kae1-associated kinase Bud32 [Candidatus Geothermarchaeota archaeon]|nr:MAG: Kae1-associated kinase Bud32 [Candidatus Geothermarchaeota archaeon]